MYPYSQSKTYINSPDMQNIYLQRSPHPNPQNLLMLYLTWQKKIKIVDSIRSVNQLTLKWREYPGLNKWGHSNHRSKVEEAAKRVKEMQCRKDLSRITYIEHGGSRPYAKECRWF